MKFPRPTQPRTSGCFPVHERGDFSKNSGILQLNKIGPFWGSVVEAMFMTSFGKRRQNQIQIDKLNAV